MITIDFETYDPYIRGLKSPYRKGKTLSMGAGWPFGDVVVLGCAVKDGDYLEWRAGDDFIQYMQDNEGATINAHNAFGYEAGICAMLGIDITKYTWIDSKIAGFYNNNTDILTLENLSQKYLGAGKQSNTLAELAQVYNLTSQKTIDEACPLEKFKGKKKAYKNAYTAAMSNMHILYLWEQNKVIEYALQDAELSHALTNKFLSCIPDMKLESEFIIAATLSRMRGIKCNFNELEKIKIDIEKQIKHEQTLIPQGLNVRSNKQLKELFHSMGLRGTRSPKGTESFTKEFFQRNKDNSTVLAIGNLRDSENFKSKFIDYLVDYRYYTGTDTIHSQLNAYGARTARMSMSSPNLQNQPARNAEWKKRIRGLFMPHEPKNKWLKIDYSAQEPRLQVHYAYKAGCAGAATIRDEFIKNPKLDSHGFVTEMVYGKIEDKEEFKIKRQIAKALNLGISYGMGPIKLAYQLGFITTKTFELDSLLDEMKKLKLSAHDKKLFICNSNLTEAVKEEVINGMEKAIEFLNLFKTKMPYLSDLADLASTVMHSRGYITVIDGANAYSPQPHKALNMLIQRSALIQTKTGYVEIYRSGKIPLLAVHDEINIELEPNEDVDKYVKIMENAITLEIPVIAEPEIGDTWGSIAKVDKSNKEYHQSAELSRSQLSDLLYSPKLFYLKHITKTIKIDNVAAFDFGNLVHTLLLEPHKLDSEFVIVDCAIRRGKRYDEAIGNADGKIVVLIGEVEKAKEMLKNVTLDLKGASIEKSFTFEYDGIACKCRPDAILADGTVIDLKTSSSAAFDNFLHSVYKYHYDVQAYMIFKGLIANNIEAHTFKWLVVEKQEPYPIATYEAGSSVMKLGRLKFEKAIELYKKCTETNTWPDFIEDNAVIEIPTYIMSRYK